MITQRAAFSVLSTPVALCDRRALSEAWYCALHVHTDGPGASSSRPRRAASTAGEKGPARLGGTRDVAKSAPPLGIAVRVGAALALPGAPVHDRRVVRSKLAQKIEQTFSKPKQAPKHASFTLEGVRGRVQILLQQTGSHTQLVALCPPSAREMVARALSEARYALAFRGLSVEADVRGFAR